MKEGGADIPGLFAVIRKWRKTLLAFVILVTVISLVTALLLPKKFYSSARLFPSNSVLQDKGRIFNPNLQHLYSVFGSADDLDRLYAMASSQAMYLFLVDTFNLVNHYKIDDEPAEARYAGMKQLKKNAVIRKSVNGELELGMWDKDKKVASDIVNTMVNKLQAMFHAMILQMSGKTLTALKAAKSLNEYDSTTLAKAISEFEISLNSEPAAFAKIEEAIPAPRAGKPRVLMIVISTFFISLFFALLSAVIAERATK